VIKRILKALRWMECRRRRKTTSPYAINLEEWLRLPGYVIRYVATVLAHSAAPKHLARRFDAIAQKKSHIFVGPFPFASTTATLLFFWLSLCLPRRLGALLPTEEWKRTGFFAALLLVSPIYLAVAAVLIRVASFLAEHITRTRAASDRDDYRRPPFWTLGGENAFAWWRVLFLSDPKTWIRLRYPRVLRIVYCSSYAYLLSAPIFTLLLWTGFFVLRLANSSGRFSNFAGLVPPLALIYFVLAEIVVISPLAQFLSAGMTAPTKFMVAAVGGYWFRDVGFLRKTVNRIELSSAHTANPTYKMKLQWVLWCLEIDVGIYRAACLPFPADLAQLFSLDAILDSVATKYPDFAVGHLRLIMAGPGGPDSLCCRRRRKKKRLPAPSRVYLIAREPRTKAVTIKVGTPAPAETRWRALKSYTFGTHEFEVGYSGAGPTNAAVSILADYFDQPPTVVMDYWRDRKGRPSFAANLYQSFERDVIQWIRLEPGESHTLRGSDIADWIAENHQEYLTGLEFVRCAQCGRTLWRDPDRYPSRGYPCDELWLEAVRAFENKHQTHTQLTGPADL
jgi:hypothetical protein